MSLLKNYLKTYYKNILANKYFFITNVLCLTIGIFSFLVIINYIIFERNFDGFHKNLDNIYKVLTYSYKGGQVQLILGTTPYPLATTAKEEFKEIESFTRMRTPAGNTVNRFDISYKNQKFDENKITFVDSTFLKIFSFKLLKGNRKLALNRPNSVIITKSLADKYFPNENPLNKMIEIRHSTGVYNWSITGVIEDVPENSSFSYQGMIAPILNAKTIEPVTADPNQWALHLGDTYLLLKEGTDYKTFEKKLGKLIKKRSWFVNNYKAFQLKYQLIPLKEMHLSTEKIYANSEKKLGNKKYLTILLISSISILLISWINYLLFQINNLHTRSKEVGVRKMSGGSPTNLITQFFIESFGLNFAAIVISILLIFLLQPYLFLIYGISISIYLFYNAISILGLIIILFSGVIITSLYFAIALSSVKAIDNLRQQAPSGKRLINIPIRRIMLIIQFAATIILMISTIIIYTQINYMKKQNINVNLNNVISIEPKVYQDSIMINQMNSFVAELKKIDNVKDISVDSDVPVGETVWLDVFKASGNENSTNTLYYMTVSPDFFSLYDINIIDGRGFSRDISSDRNSVLLNEKAMEILGLKQPKNAIGKYIIHQGTQYLVIGIVQNYHNKSLKEDYEPIVYFSNWRNNKYSVNKYISVKIDGQYNGEVVSKINRFFKSYFNGRELSIKYLPDILNDYYSEDNKISTLFNLFTVIAIILSCIGILGVSLYDVYKKTKEIAIRKVNGAKTFQILYKINMDILKYVTLSIVIGIPIAYYVMNNWLLNYPVRISMPWYIFIIAGFTIILISVLTTSIVTIRVTRQNIYDALKSE